ncbi:MAG: hypothetical protein M3327_11385 [Actinomycetota bacterium]|nr:hypothetical protein [Actinomycetota bacterium]
MAGGRENLRPRPPFEPGNQVAVTHGVHSERQIVPRAASQKRRFLRQIGLRQADLDGIGVALLDNWARAQAKVEILDRYFAEHGLLDGRGKPRAAAAIYFTALNSARLSATRLAEHLRAAEPRGPTLAEYLAEKYRD